MNVTDMWDKRPHEPLSLLTPSFNAVVEGRDEMNVPKFSSVSRHWSRWLAAEADPFWMPPILTQRDLVCAMGPAKLENARTYVQNYDFGTLKGPQRPELSSLRLEMCVPETTRRTEPCSGPMLDFQFEPEHCLNLGEIGPTEATDNQVHCLPRKVTGFETTFAL